MLTRGGTKLLDFGLAKRRPAGTLTDVTVSATVSGPLTQQGTILGTLQYMSPEQVQGKEADARSDIFSFGAVVYEMATGSRAFDGDSPATTVAAILDREPPLLSFKQPAAPRSLDRVVKTCLAKDPDDRWQSASDLMRELRWITEDGLLPTLASRTPRRRWARAATWVVAVAAAVAGTAWFGSRRQVSPDQVRFEIATPPTTDPASIAISPDGRLLVFAATSDGTSQLWLRPLDSPSMRPLPGTGDAARPFWSPDGRSIGFFAKGRLKRIDVENGSMQDLAAVESPLGGAWNREGSIIFVRGPGGPVERIPAEGGQPAVAAPSRLQANVFSSLQFLPNGRHFLVHAEGTEPGMYVGDLTAREAPKRLLDAQAGFYISSGYLLFARQSTLFAQPFDPNSLELSGVATPIAEGLAAYVDGGRGPALSVSTAGRIVYRTGTPQTQFVWYERSGAAIETVVGSDIGSGFNSSLSPDAGRLAMSQNAGGAAADIWLLDLVRGAPSLFTTDRAFDLMPVWSPNGSNIAFSSNRSEETSFDVYVKPVSGIGDEQVLVAHELGDQPTDWSGGFILYNRQISIDNNDIWAVSPDGDGKPFPVVETRFDETNGQFSPDGKWIAYQSDRTGQREIYVQPFPGPAPSVAVSIGGGVQARWRRDGRELFYLAPDGRLMVVPTRIDSTGAKVDKPVSLFAPQIGGQWRHPYGRNYMVSRDGQRFLVETPKPVSTPISVFLNWQADPS
jgi:Tol biopolymer transport system component